MEAPGCSGECFCKRFASLLRWHKPVCITIPGQNHRKDASRSLAKHSPHNGHSGRNGTTIGMLMCCDAIRCTKCDFKVISFHDMRWASDVVGGAQWLSFNTTMRPRLVCDVCSLNSYMRRQFTAQHNTHMYGCTCAPRITCSSETTTQPTPNWRLSCALLPLPVPTAASARGTQPVGVRARCTGWILMLASCAGCVLGTCD